MRRSPPRGTAIRGAPAAPARRARHRALPQMRRPAPRVRARVLPRMPSRLPARVFVQGGERLSASLLAWRHSGFSVHNGVRVPAGDIEGRKKLAQYMLRAPLSLEKMTYLPDAGLSPPQKEW